MYQTDSTTEGGMLKGDEWLEEIFRIETPCLEPRKQRRTWATRVTASGHLMHRCSELQKERRGKSADSHFKIQRAKSPKLDKKTTYASKTLNKSEWKIHKEAHTGARHELCEMEDKRTASQVARGTACMEGRLTGSRTRERNVRWYNPVTRENCPAEMKGEMSGNTDLLQRNYSSRVKGHKTSSNKVSSFVANRLAV